MNKTQIKPKEIQSLSNFKSRVLFKKGLFELNYYILKSNLIPSGIEIVSLLIQTMQFLSYVFDPQVISIILNIYNYIAFINMERQKDISNSHSSV